MSGPFDSGPGTETTAEAQVEADTGVTGAAPSGVAPVVSPFAGEPTWLLEPWVMLRFYRANDWTPGSTKTPARK